LFKTPVAAKGTRSGAIAGRIGRRATAMACHRERGRFSLPMVRPINLPMPTLGGSRSGPTPSMLGWRIQRNVYSSHCRLLDRNIRRAWAPSSNPVQLRARQKRNPAAVRNGHVVMLVHGLGRSAGAFALLEDCLRREGYETANVNYPSTRLGIAAHADNLEHIIQSLEGVTMLSFVTHSLGALVVRDLLARERSGGTSPSSGSS
jgi:hypothetical protein